MGSVLIVGCGVFGLSTALDLAKKGYDVTAIDSYEPPSPWSAAHDYNKIIRTEYADMMYTKMAVEAVHMWRADPKFKGIYNECGRVMVTPERHAGRREFEKKGYANLRKLGEAADIRNYEGGDELAVDFKSLRYNVVDPGQKSTFNPECALGHASNSLVAVYNAAKAEGVKFIFGPNGRADYVGMTGSSAFVVTEAGSKLAADQVLICAGANTASIVGLDNQQKATGLFAATIKLTEEEYEFYKDMPIIFDAERGFFFPPDPATSLIKLVVPGYRVRNVVDGVALPRFHNQNPTDTMPRGALRCAKVLLAKYVPELVYHDILDPHICWIADTVDSHFLIDKVPGYSNLFVATGDAGHGYKFLPNIGKYITARMDGTLDAEKARAWRWKAAKSNFDVSKNKWKVITNFLEIDEIDDWIPASVSSKL